MKNLKVLGCAVAVSSVASIASAQDAGSAFTDLGISPTSMFSANLPFIGAAILLFAGVAIGVRLVWKAVKHLKRA